VIMRDLDDVVGEYSGLSLKVLEYSQVMKRLVDSSKEPGFSEQSWAPLAELVSVDEFERVGNFKEVMNWPDYISFLTNWAMSSEWECSFKRITEAGDVVFLELEERLKFGDFSSAVNSVSVYEFNGAGKIRHLDIYLQMAMPEGEMLESYEGVQISE